MSELLKDICVRITATDKDNKSCVGSGSIINYKRQNYVITAEHCINGTINNKKENRLDIQSRTFKIEYKKMADEVFKEISHNGIFIENEENDFAVIQIKQVNHDLPKIEFLDKLFVESKNYTFRGFPVNVLKDYSRKYDITINDKDFTPNTFLIKAEDEFEDSSANKVSYLASGISGSGIFLVDDGTLNFVGIVNKLHNEAGSYNELICCKSEIIKLAIDEKLKEIEKEQAKENTSKMKFENALNHFSNPSPIFTGRINELKELKEAYNSFNIFAISGFGGIGKTEFINQFIYELDIADKKNQITWLDGNENSSFELFVKESGFKDILQSNDTDQNKYAAFKDKINEHNRILFLDNFHDIEKADLKFKEFIEFANGKIPKAKIFIISRTEPKFKNVLFKSLHLSGLTEAVDFAKQLIKTKFSNLKITEINLEKLCNYVDKHPFAIELSLNLCESYGFDDVIGKITEYKSYLPELEELSQRLFEDVLNHPTTKKEERDFIFQFSIFNEKVDAETIKNVLGIDLFKAVHLLKQKNLINIENNLYDTHPLIKEFCYEKLDNKRELHQKAAEYFISKRTDKLEVTLEKRIFFHLKGCHNISEIENSLNKYGRILVRQAYYDFVLSLVEYLTTKNINNPFHNLLLGNINKIKGDWNKALSFYETVEKNPINKELALESLLEKSAILHSKGNISKALNICYASLEIAEKNNFQKYIAWAYNGIASIKSFYGENNHALELYEKALIISKDLGEKQDISDLLNNIGSIYDRKGDKDKALKYHNDSLKIREEIGDKEGIASSYNNIGSFYNSKGDKDKALKYHNDSLKIKEEIGDKEGIASSYNNIGLIYSSKGDTDKALKYHNDSLKIREEIGDKEGIATSFNNIGSIYSSKGDKDKALKYYEDSLKLSEDIGDKEGIATSFNNIGSIYSSKGDKDKAIKYYKDCLKLSEDIGNKERIATSFNNIGSIYQKKGDKDKALKYYKDCLKILENMGNKKDIETSYYNIGLIHFESKEFEKSLFFLFKSFIFLKQIGHIELNYSKKAIDNIRNKLGLIQFREVAKKTIEGLELEYRNEINLEDFLPSSLPEKTGKNYGHNTLVKVKFTDGRIAEYKYKHVEQKIENGDCEIVEE